MAAAGGGVLSDALLSISNSTIQFNSAEDGGGVFARNGFFAVGQTLLYKNQASNNGGGAYVGFGEGGGFGRMTVLENSADNDGGGIYISTASTNRVSIADIGIIGNRAGQNGGGLFASGFTVFERGYIGRNFASDNGGGLFIGDSRSTSVLLENMSMSGNEATQGSAIYGARPLRANFMSIGYSNGSNSAVYKVDSAFEFEFTSAAIDASGQGSNPNIVNCAGATGQISGSNAFDSDGTCGFGTRNSATDPMLLPVADHGGIAPALSLHPDSPAIGAGVNCPTTDQRGAPRPSTQCDVGAFQTGATVPTAIALQTQQTIAPHKLSPFIVTLLLACLTGWIVHCTTGRNTRQLR